MAKPDAIMVNILDTPAIISRYGFIFSILEALFLIWPGLRVAGSVAVSPWKSSGFHLLIYVLMVVN